MSYSKKTAKQLQATKQKDIEIVLSQENLDLYQLEVCLNIDENITTIFLAEHTDAQECVKKLFEDPNTYLVQKRLRDNGSLQKVFDVNTQFVQTEEKLKKLPGEEIFRIFTTKEDDIADNVCERLRNS